MHNTKEKTHRYSDMGSMKRICVQVRAVLIAHHKDIEKERPRGSGFFMNSKRVPYKRILICVSNSKYESKFKSPKVTHGAVRTVRKENST